MRKIFFTLSLALVTTITIAQIGIKAGVNFSNVMVVGDGIGMQSKFSFHAGAFYQKKLSEKFSIQPELIYSRQGGQSRATYIDDRVDIDYINLPVMFNYYATPNFYIQAGPQLGILISANYIFGSDVSDVREDYGPVDLSAGLGVGYQLKAILLELRFNAGITNMAPDHEYDQYLRNQVIQFSMGYKFRK
jgi:hypothetical protein